MLQTDVLTDEMVSVAGGYGFEGGDRFHVGDSLRVGDSVRMNGRLYGGDGVPACSAIWTLVTWDHWLWTTTLTCLVLFSGFTFLLFSCGVITRLFMVSIWKNVSVYLSSTSITSSLIATCNYEGVYLTLYFSW